MAINVNQGPERVEATLTPIGTTLPQGSSTARTALIIATKKSDAPLNTPTSVTSLSQFEQLFGTQDDMGEVYLNVQGFYQNGGDGAELVIVAVSPSGITDQVYESASDEAPRSILGSSGQLLDGGEILTSATITSYTASTGELVLNVSGASGEYDDVKQGDLVKDEEGRLFPIISKKASNTLIIQSNLDRDLAKSSNSIAADSTDVDIIRLFSEGEFAGKTVLQEGDTYASGVSVSASDTLITTTGFDTTINGVISGDIIVDGTERYLVVDIIDGNNLTVDRAGLSGPTVDFKRGDKYKAIQTTTDSGDELLDLAVEPYEATTDSIRFNLADSSNNPPENSLNGYYLEFDDGTKALISDNSIVAESTVISSSLGTNTYNASTGILTISGETLQTDGAVAGDVFIDSAGSEFVIQSVESETELQLKKNLPTPSSLAGGSVNKGAIELQVDQDLTNKVSGETGADNTGSIYVPQNKYVFSNDSTLESESYFVVEPDFQFSDYSGSSADLTGLRALDAVDVINLVAIPGIYDPSVQGALIDYCSVTRDDCMALVSIPEFISNAANNNIVVSNLVIDTVQESTNGSVISFTGSPDLSEASTYDLLVIGSKQFVIDSVSDEDSQIVVTATTGIPTVGAVSVQAPSAIAWKEQIVNKPTTKAAWYYNHLLISDSEGIQQVVDPVAHVAGVMARIDSNIAEGGVSHAPAGIGLAQIAGIEGLQLQVSERLDAGPLRLAFINRITTFPGNGRFIFGGYTAAGASATPDEQLIQVIRSLLFVKSSLETGLVGFLWENNSPVNRQNIENTIRAFLRANSYLFPSGLPEEQQFQVVSVTPDEEALAQGLVEAIVKVRFNTAIRFIDIPLQFPLPLNG